MPSDKEIQKPEVIAFEVTQKCRFDCKHCRAGKNYDPKRKEMSTYPCKMIMKSISDYVSDCVVILTGGEPMERKDIVELVEFGTKQDLKMAMATCGYLLDEENIKELKKAGLRAFSFSIDFATPEKHDEFRNVAGAFDLAMKAIELAKSENIRFQINTTVTKSNLDELEEICRLAEDMGAYCYNPFILVPTGKGSALKDEVLDKEEYEKLLNELYEIKQKSPIMLRVTCGPQFSRICHERKVDDKKITPQKGCLAGTGFAFISYKGDVQTCGFLNISAGNLLENGFNFRKIWEDSVFLNQMRELAGYKGKCGFCDYLQKCGGCRARAYAITGDYLAPDPVCDYISKGKESDQESG